MAGYSKKQLTCTKCGNHHYRWGNYCGNCYNKLLFIRSKNYRKSQKKYEKKRRDYRLSINRITTQCIKCGCKFVTGRHSQKRCSNCVDKKMVVSLKNCSSCKISFIPKRVKQVHCSKQCYSRYYYTIRDPFKRRLYGRIREAQDKGAIGSYTPEDWKKILDQHENKCKFCGILGTESKLTIDHIIPISKGGTNYKENLQPLCKSCNSKKGNKLNYCI